jgi:hypothetical protein
VPLEHARGDGLDGGAVGDVAGLGLAPQLLRERRMQRSPRAASRRAISTPMPEEAPVTTATRLTQERLSL